MNKFLWNRTSLAFWTKECVSFCAQAVMGEHKQPLPALNLLPSTPTGTRRQAQDVSFSQTKRSIQDSFSGQSELACLQTPKMSFHCWNVRHFDDNFEITVVNFEWISKHQVFSENKNTLYESGTPSKPFPPPVSTLVLISRARHTAPQKCSCLWLDALSPESSPDQTERGYSFVFGRFLVPEKPGPLRVPHASSLGGTFMLQGSGDTDKSYMRVSGSIS